MTTKFLINKEINNIRFQILVCILLFFCVNPILAEDNYYEPFSGSEPFNSYQGIEYPIDGLNYYQPFSEDLNGGIVYGPPDPGEEGGIGELPINNGILVLLVLSFGYIFYIYIKRKQDNVSDK